MLKMKGIALALIILLVSISGLSQVNLEVDGYMKVSQIAKDNGVDSIVVQNDNGVLALRDMIEFQFLSISSDTLYLSGGGFVKLPAFGDKDPSNEIQSITKNGSVISLSHGGGIVSDSINVFTAGSGIIISDNIISSTIVSPPPVTSPWYLGQDTLGGIVFYIHKGADGMDHGLIVSTIEGSGSWGSHAGSTRTWDGDYNTNLMTSSQIKNWVTTNFGAEWYIPSIDELGILRNNRFLTNMSLDVNGHTLLASNEFLKQYWSSTIAGNLNSPQVMEFTEGYVTGGNPGSAYLVRAVRPF